MIAVDSNVLIYAHRAETDFHTQAAAHLVSLAERTVAWGLPVFCVGEFIRVVTHRRILNPPSTLSQAVSFLEGVVASPSCRVVRPGPDFVGLLAATVQSVGARGNLVFDAQIAALCREHGISTILTNDRDFMRFDHLRVRLLGESARN